MAIEAHQYICQFGEMVISLLDIFIVITSLAFEPASVKCFQFPLISLFQMLHHNSLLIPTADAPLLLFSLEQFGAPYLQYCL